MENAGQCSLIDSVFKYQLMWHCHDCRAGTQETPPSSFVEEVSERENV